MQILKPTILYVLSSLLIACGSTNDATDNQKKSSDAALLKLELSYAGQTYTTNIANNTITLEKPLPHDAKSVHIKTLEISPKATSTRYQGEVLAIDHQLIEFTIQAENGLINTFFLKPIFLSVPYRFEVDQHYFYQNSRQIAIKGVVYTPNYPGYYPWDIERVSSLPAHYEASIRADIANIKTMGANTVRLWGAPAFTYQAIKEAGDLLFLQTIWVDTEAADFQAATFKASTKSYIREIIDRIFSVYVGNNPPLLAYIIGNELSEASVLATNSAHPGITTYAGRYINATGVNASQAFIAEMADYAKSYTFDTYGKLVLVSYANDIRTPESMDVPFLDFISHNAYSYAVPYYRPGTAAGSSSGTLFQGWVEEIKARNPDKPLLISETGLSVSPGNPHVGPPNYGYGGNTEPEQATGLLQNLNDLATAAQPVAGVCLHEYLDAWWKFDAVTSQEPAQPEEWFGLVRFRPNGSWYATEGREAYTRIREAWE